MAERVVEKKQQFQGRSLKVTLAAATDAASDDDEEEDDPQTTVVVEGCGPHVTDDAIILYFENKRKGGGVNIEHIRREENGQIFITFISEEGNRERERDMFYLTTHSTHFIYGYLASDIWLRTILIVRKETRCRHIGYSYRLTARVLLYAPSHRQDNTHHSLCYTSCGALAGTRNSSMGPPHDGSIRRPTAPRANALPLSYVTLRGR